MALIRFRCVRCQYPLKIDSGAAGKKLHCPVCYHELTVPVESTVKAVDPLQLYAADEKPVDVREMRHRREFASLRCKVCLTNIAVRKEQIGSEVICPDCGTKTVVPPEIARQVDAAVNDTLDKIMLGLGDDSTKNVYGVRDGNSAPLEDWTSRFPVYCRLCTTMMYATEEQIGSELLCPDCHTTTAVPPKPQRNSAAPPLPVSFEGSSTFGIETANLAEPLVPVVCGLCGTRMYAGESQIGGFKTCPDCERQTEIKPVLKKELVQPEIAGGEYGVNAAAPPPRPVIRTLTDYRYVDGSLDKEFYDTKPPEERTLRKRPRSTKSTETDQETTEEHRKRFIEAEKYLPPVSRPLPKRPLTEGLLTPILTWNVMVRILISTGLGCAAILLGLALPGLFVIVSLAFGGMLLLLWGSFQTNLCWSVFHFSTDGNDEFDEWIEFVLVGSFGLWLWLFSYSALAGTPGLFIASFLPGERFVQYTTGAGETIGGENPAAVAIRDFIFICLSHWIFFPLVFLSCMATGSYFTPFSVKTFQTLVRYTGIWMRFYGLAATIVLLPQLAYIGLFYLVGWLVGFEYLSIPFVPLGFLFFNFFSILYFRLLGRFAWVIEESIRREKADDDD